jgi:hypothetical protein
MTRKTFTKADVDYLVKEPKFISEIPTSRDVDGFLRIQAPVFRKSEPKTRIVGLLVIARVAGPVSGIPSRGKPSACLEWNGVRIRGIDYELRHDNPDGSTIKGWHEHIWTPEHDDRLVRQFAEPSQKSLLDLFECGLERWNIEVSQVQLRLKNGNAKV